MTTVTRAFLGHTVIPRTDVATDINVSAGALVYVYEADGTTLFTDTMYAASTGVTTRPNPMVADSNGIVTAFIDNNEARIVTLRVGSSTGTAYPSMFIPDPFSILRGEGPYPEIDVRMYGALGDGSTDDRAAIQAAIDAAPSTGAVINLSGGPGTTYLLNSTSGSFSYTDATGTATVSYALQLKSNITLKSDGATLKRGATFNTTNRFLIVGTTALSNVTIKNVVIDQDATTGTKNENLGWAGRRSMALWFRYGATGLVLDHVTFKNCGTHWVFAVGTDHSGEAGQSSGVRLSDCAFSRSLAGPIQDPAYSHPNILRNSPENVSVATIWNTSHVVVERTRFLSTLTGSTAGSGGLAIYAGSSVACPGSAAMLDIVVRDCEWTATQATALFIRGVNSTVIRGVRLYGNTYANGGKWIEKGWLGLQDLGLGGLMYDVTIANNTITNAGYAFSAAGDSETNACSYIDIGNDAITGLTITGNTMNGADDTGTLPYIGETKPFGRAIGIGLRTSVVVSCTGNTVSNLGGPGIRVDGGTGTIVASGSQKTSLVGNTIANCCRMDHASTVDAGILVNDFVSDITINGNTVTDCGDANGGSTVTAGIGFLASTAAGSSCFRITITGNTCTNFQTSTDRRQKYGIRMGIPGSSIVLQPFQARITNNNVYNNITAGIFADTTYVTNSRSYEIENNDGWQRSALIASTMTGAVSNGAIATQTGLTCTGAVPGDLVQVTHDGTLQNGLILSGAVTAANTVAVSIFNATAGSLTPPAGNLRIRVAHRNWL